MSQTIFRSVYARLAVRPHTPPRANPRATTVQVRTLYFCGPKAGDHPAPMPQHYFMGPDPERWATSPYDKPSKTAQSTTPPLKPLTTVALIPPVYVAERSAIQREIARLEALLREPAVGRWERVAREWEERKKEEWARLEELEWRKRMWEGVWRERYAWGEGV